MSMRALAVGTAVVMVIAGCGTSKTSKTDSAEGKISKQSGNESKSEEYSGPIKFLEQNWNYATRMEWWYTSQGSRVIPYEWFLALELPDSETLVRSNENLESLRFIPWPAHEKWNPDGLPIGFVKDIDADTHVAHIGFNCSACHTGLVKHGDDVVLVEGAPAHSDFDRFITQIGESLIKTLADEAKFARFAERVVGNSVEAAVVDALKADVQVKSAGLNERIKVNHPPHPNGFARLDAFGNIFNEGSVFSINEPLNAKPANAPVSYPVVWDTPQHEVVQWNGAAVNAGIGPYTRNVGEVVGVFGDLRIEEVTVLGNKKLRYRHHVNISGLERLEEILTTLWSPEWPEELLGELDGSKVKAGEAHYQKKCVQCHSVIRDRTDPNRHVGELMVDISETGTDPLAASNPFYSKSKTGMLKGYAMIPLLQILPSHRLIEQFDASALLEFGEEATTSKVVGNGVLGILREELGLIKVVEGLPAYIKAAKVNSSDVPRYKARPLNGLWSSAPFLHNGSVPNLWELLQKPDARVKKFHVGSWKIDAKDVGFDTQPGGNTTEFDTSLPGNSNAGHDYGTDLEDTQKRELIEYIKSL